MEQFVAFLQAQVVNVPDPLRTDFEHGFRKGYGKKGAAVFAQALNQAKESATRAHPTFWLCALATQTRCL
jgi:hypothetical protein